jgi:hypothetical protein
LFSIFEYGVKQTSYNVPERASPGKFIYFLGTEQYGGRLIRKAQIRKTRDKMHNLGKGYQAFLDIESGELQEVMFGNVIRTINEAFSQ